ncbi:mechanosensitive ion channel protein MscS [Pseudooceanicola lipolyticus]|uniref:Mechanosensitive ion channel protein MscS n=1 Tax=Pseudooceanicola lipolyticus TaxID=2029104 RepID=A0A2M8J0F8_9RHOB|nr:mechanosensitive ion channel domain-containing protein [Pseudooceanicola lipolyticus]PJE36280.1 mechanosensitive ion channel protein MscS [Pseudooceanicola lipolyticus]
MRQGAILRAFFFVLAFLCLSAAAFAQDEPATSRTDELSQAIRDAAERGVSVIVIDSEGNLIRSGRPEEPPAPAEVLADPGMEDASELLKAQTQVQKFRETLSNRLEALPVSLNEVRYILRATSPDGRIMTYVEALVWTLVLLLAAMLLTVQLYAKRFLRGFVVGRILEAPQGYREKMPFLVFRFLMGISVTIVAMIVAYAMSLIILGSTDDISMQFTFTAIYVAFFLSRTVSDMWRMILSPFLSQYRIPHFSDRDAKKLYYWASTLATIDVIAIVFSTWIHDFGLNYNVYAILYGAITLFAAVLNVLMVLFNRRAITLAICNGQPREQLPWVVRAVAVAWAPLIIGYVIFGWFELAFDLVLEQSQSIPMIAGAYGVMMSIIIVYGGINYLIERYFDRSIARNRMNADMEARDAEEDQREPMPERPAITTYEQLARRVAGILAFVAGSYALLRIWDPGNTVMSESFIGRGLDVVTIIFIGYIVYNFFRIWIDSRIAEEGGPAEAVGEPGDEGGGASVSRLGTLLPLFRGAILAVVVVSIVLIVLLELGINVSPLFAGAGVVGLAVGFGAQTLVRDIFSGAFFLIDDAFRKGEYIDIGEVKGTVEKISVRSFQLRHHLGALNTIPFGEIKVLTNYSRDWVMMKLPLRVTYDTDVEKVRKLIKKLGQQLLEDPVIGENFLQPLKSQGVIEMQDSAMIIRVKFMTKPGDQWLVRKKVYEEIRELFAREGIRFAHREVTVRLADSRTEDLSPQQREAITGAVQATIDEEDMNGNGGGGRGDDR